MIIISFIYAISLLQIFHCDNDVVISDVQVEDNDDITPLTTEEKSVDTVDTVDSEPFIATNEWQVIKPNQPIPKGLHVRINFQTGVKEAKLLDEDSSSSKSEEDSSSSSSKEDKSSAGPKIVVSEESKAANEFSQVENDKIYVTKRQLKDALLEFRDKVGTKVVEDVTWSKDAKAAMEEQLEQENKVRKKFRSIEEIRAELEETMNLNVKADIELMKELLRYITADNSTLNEKCSALENLEYYVHQIDNAVDLDTVGGLEPIVLLLNSTHEDIQDRAANLIGAAVQNNNKVRDIVLRYGGLRLLLQLTHYEKKVSTKKRALYALSALIRGNSDALNALIRSNGVKHIIHITKDKSLPTSLQVKAIDLLFGLIEEQNEQRKKLEASGESDVSKETQLNQLLVENGLCDILVPLVKSEDFYMKEKVMNAIKVSVDVCKDTLMQQDQMRFLEVELLQLEENIRTEDDEEFKTYLQTMKNQFKKNVLDKLKYWTPDKGGRTEL